MPIQIDRMDTSVEITNPRDSGSSTERQSAAAEGARESELRAALGRLMAEELDRFLRNRGF